MKLELIPQPNALAMRLLETMAEHGHERRTLKEWCEMANIPALSGYICMAKDYARYFGLRVICYDEDCTFQLSRITL